MRLLRFGWAGRVGYGRLEGQNVRPLAGCPWDGLGAAGPPLPLAAVELLAPAAPSKIIAVGRNYEAHARERGAAVPEEPMLFSKAVSAIIGPGRSIRLPDWVGRVDYEAELAVVIGRPTRRISPAKAGEAILGLTCLNDVSARELQRRDGQFTRGKGLDTFCPLGPWIQTGLDPADLLLRAELNGRVVQEERTSRMIFPVPELIAYISRTMTLQPGDVIATGTPAGVGPLEAGDIIAVEIEGVGRLVNPVAAEET